LASNNESYNINADVVAAKLATVLKAEKLLMLTNISGVLDKAGKLLTDLTARQIDELVCRRHHFRRHAAQDRRRAWMPPRAACNAVHIVDGRVPHVLLLEILTDQAFGTMIRLALDHAGTDLCRLPTDARSTAPGAQTAQARASAAFKSCKRSPPCWSNLAQERITTAALAARLDVSEAALYRHFASKAQMFEGLIEFIEQSVFTLVNHIIAA